MGLFDRIRKGDLSYPSYVQAQAKDIMVQLLNQNPDKRLGGGPTDVGEVKAHAFWSDLDLNQVLAKRIAPPFKPDLASANDVKYFDKEFLNMPVANSEVEGAGEVKKFDGFTMGGRLTGKDAWLCSRIL